MTPTPKSKNQKNGLANHLITANMSELDLQILALMFHDLPDIGLTEVRSARGSLKGPFKAYSGTSQIHLIALNPI